MSSETDTLYVYFSSELFVGLYFSQSLNLVPLANTGIYSYVKEFIQFCRQETFPWI